MVNANSSIRRRIRNLPLLRSYFGRIALLCLMLLIAFGILYPIAMVAFTAFKSGAELIRNPMGMPRNWTMENFRDAWDKADMARLSLNSVIVSLGVVTGTVVFSSMGAFALARLNFLGKAAVPALLTIGLVVPFETLVIPLFHTLKPLGLLNTWWAMILPQVGLSLPFGILLLRGFMADLPQELFDASEIDGCGLWAQFFYLALPLARPALIALSIFQFLWSWNQYLLPLVMVQDQKMRTMPLGLSFFVGRYSTNYGGLAAAAVLALLPTTIFYLLFHRQILRANLTGAFK